MIETEFKKEIEMILGSEIGRVERERIKELLKDKLSIRL